MNKHSMMILWILKSEIYVNETLQAMCVKSLRHSVMSDSFATPWTVAHQAPLSTRFPRQEYWSGLPFPPTGDILHPGTEPESAALANGFFTTSATLSLFSWLVVSNSATPWTAAHQVPVSVRFPRQEYWSGLPFPSPVDHPDSGTELASPALADGFFIH